MAGTSKREGGRGHWRPRRAAGRRRQTGTAMAADAGAVLVLMCRKKGYLPAGGRLCVFAVAMQQNHNLEKFGQLIEPKARKERMKRSNGLFKSPKTAHFLG